MTGKVLLIEDEMFVRDLYERVLKHSGFDISSAPDGVAGLEAATQTKPSLILLDIMMPGLNGIELLQRLKQDPSTSSIPVVLLTNLGQGDIIKQAMGMGASGYFMKVRTSPHQIVDLVRRYLENPNLKLEPDPTRFD